MSNHFTGLSLGPPLGDQRLDLCDLYAFPSPATPDHTVLILNANPNADALHPDAIYRLAIDNDGDLRNDIAFSFVFSEPWTAARPSTSSWPATARPNPPRWSARRSSTRSKCLRRDNACHRPAGSVTFFAGPRSDAFFFDFDGIKNLFDITGGRNFTAPHLGRDLPVDGRGFQPDGQCVLDRDRDADHALGASPDIRIWGRCSLRRDDGTLVHVDRAGHPSVSSFFNTDETKEAYNAGEPRQDRARWLEQFIHLMGHTGGYDRDEAIAAIDAEGTLPDMLTYNPSKPAKYPNGRTFTDDVIDYRLSFLTKGDCPPSGLAPHTDTLGEFPYLGPPHGRG